MFPRFSTVFWKIFLSYWLVTLSIVGLTGAGVAVWVSRDYDELQRGIPFKMEASKAATLFEIGGQEALLKWLSDRFDRFERTDRFGRRTPRSETTYLLNEAGIDLLGKPVPRHLAPDVLRTGTFEAPPGTQWTVEKVVSDNGNNYIFAMAAFNRGSNNNLIARTWNEWLPPPLRGYSILAAVMITGLISFFVARNLTSPIRGLQQAAQRISSGDLGVRVDPKVSRRGDELGDLGKEFDKMAAQIGQLLATQKRMLRDISHELRSPLARLQIALELARKAAADKGITEHDRIEKEAQRLDELIGQVMSLVRMEDQSGDVEKEPQDIDALLQDVVGNAQFEAGDGKKVVLESSGPVVLNINFELMYSAIENIVRNSLRYTADNSEVKITMTQQDNQICIRVRDYGPGVSKEALPHLFEPFYRETAARDRASGGYGLGLAISAHAVRLHQGQIAAENAEGGGLEVTIKLPIKRK